MNNLRVKRRLARILRKWEEPHGKIMTDSKILKGVEVDVNGIVDHWITPINAHCPCCLENLIALREEITNQKGVLACHIEVVDIPQSERWTSAINESAKY